MIDCSIEAIGILALIEFIIFARTILECLYIFLHMFLQETSILECFIQNLHESQDLAQFKSLVKTKTF